MDHYWSSVGCLVDEHRILATSRRIKYLAGDENWVISPVWAELKKQMWGTAMLESAPGVREVHRYRISVSAILSN